ncbi:MAG: ATP-binding protein [candidate division WOR-3 bacterium]
MRCFIGVVKKKEVADYCERELCILDAWESAQKKYKDVQQGDIGFIFDIANDDLLYGFKAKSEPIHFTDTPFEKIEYWDKQTNARKTIKLDLKIPLELTNSKIKRKIGGTKELLISSGVRFTYTYPEPRVYDESVGQKILNALKNIPPESVQIKEKYRVTTKLDAKEEAMLSQADRNYPLQESDRSFEDIIGLDNIKQYIRKLITAADDGEKCKKYDIQVCRGFFLFGPPGTGKTIFAQSVANELQSKFFEISPSIISGFPGDAERLIELFLTRRFEHFETEKRGVIIFDEAEALLPKRDQSYMSGTMARIVPTFLRVIDKLLKDDRFRHSPIFLFAISNHPEVIDDAFLRPGRFANLYYVGLPDDDEYMEILKVFLQKRAEVTSSDLLNDNGLKIIVAMLNKQTDEIKRKLYINGPKESHDEYGRFSPADIERIINEAALEAYVLNTQISAEIIEAVLQRIMPSVTLDILQINDDFRKNHPNAINAKKIIKK